MPIAYDTPIKTNFHSLDRVLAVSLPILLSLEKPRCEPCTSLDEPLKALAWEYAGQALIVRLEDVTQGSLQDRFRISHLPTLLLWKEGREVGRLEGAVPREVLRQNLEFLVGKTSQFTPASGPSIALSVPSSKTPGSSDARPSDSPQRTTPPGAADINEGAPKIVTDASFEQDVLRAPLPVLVDFWAPWCGPCRMVSPIVEELGREYRGRLRVAKVNTDENPYHAGRLGIQGIPTLILFKGGHPVDRVVGAAPKPTLKQFIDRNL